MGGLAGFEAGAMKKLALKGGSKGKNIGFRGGS